MPMKNKTNIISWIVRLVAAVIFFQTLYFKFTAHPDSVYIFSELGIEPYGRIGIGILELICGILLLVPRTAGIGAFLGVGIMGGAILGHLTQLGIEVKEDGGTLFYLALVVFVCCLITVFIHRKDIPILEKYV